MRTPLRTRGRNLFSSSHSRIRPSTRAPCAASSFRPSPAALQSGCGHHGFSTFHVYFPPLFVLVCTFRDDAKRLRYARDPLTLVTQDRAPYFLLFPSKISGSPLFLYGRLHFPLSVDSPLSSFWWVYRAENPTAQSFRLFFSPPIGPL